MRVASHRLCRVARAAALFPPPSPKRAGRGVEIALELRLRPRRGRRAARRTRERGQGRHRWREGARAPGPSICGPEFPPVRSSHAIEAIARGRQVAPSRRARASRRATGRSWRRFLNWQSGRLCDRSLRDDGVHLFRACDDSSRPRKRRGPSARRRAKGITRALRPLAHPKRYRDLRRRFLLALNS
jgi:hypothetical protein